MMISDPCSGTCKKFRGSARRKPLDVRRKFLQLPLQLAAALALLSIAHSEEISFSKEIAPIFRQHCTGCHRDGKAKGKYRIDSYNHAMKALVAGKIDESELYHRIITDDEDERMPVDADPLKKSDIALIRTWIEQGAKYDAENPDAPLAEIVPAKPHPPAPEFYPRPIPVTAMVFANDGNTLFTGGYHEILVWNTAEARLMRRIPDNGQRTYDLALSPDGTLLAAATGSPGEAGELRIFEAESGKVVATPIRTDDVALCVAFSPDGHRLAFGSTDGRLRIFSSETWKETHTLTAHSDWLNAVAWDASGTRVATAGRDKVAKVFDLNADGKRLSTFSGHTEPVRGVAFHPNGNEVISYADDGLLVRWRIADGKKSGDLANLGRHEIGFELSSEKLFATAPDGSAVEFNAAEQKRLREFKTEAQPISVAAQGSNLAAGSFDGRIFVFDLETGSQTGSFPGSPLRD